MRTLLCTFAFVIGLIPVLAQDSAPSAKSAPAAPEPTGFEKVQRDIWKHSVMEAAKYIRANPDADDHIPALNVILQGLQNLGKYQQMLPFLERRYELLKKNDPDNVEAIFSETAATLLSLNHQFGRHEEVQKWRDRLFIDWLGKPQGEEVDGLLVWFNREFAMPQVDQALTFAFTDMDGKAHDLADYKGSVILLNFWDSTCDVCRSEKAIIAAGLDAYADRGLKVFGFAVDDDKDVLDDYLKSADVITWPQVYDNDPRHELMRRLSLPGVPMNFIIDQTGTVVARDLRGEDLLSVLDAVFGVEPRGAAGSGGDKEDVDGLLNIVP